MPAGAEPFRFGIVTSTLKTRLLGSAAGKTEVICPSNSMPGKVFSLQHSTTSQFHFRHCDNQQRQKAALTKDVSATYESVLPGETNMPLSIDFCSTNPFNGALSAVSLRGIDFSVTTACAPVDLAFITSICDLAESALAWTMRTCERAAASFAVACSSCAFAAS